MCYSPWGCRIGQDWVTEQQLAGRIGDKKRHDLGDARKRLGEDIMQTALPVTQESFAPKPHCLGNAKKAEEMCESWCRFTSLFRHLGWWVGHARRALSMGFIVFYRHPESTLSFRINGWATRPQLKIFEAFGFGSAPSVVFQRTVCCCPFSKPPLF